MAWHRSNVSGPQAVCYIRDVDAIIFGAEKMQAIGWMMVEGKSLSNIHEKTAEVVAMGCHFFLKGCWIGYVAKFFMSPRIHCTDEKSNQPVTKN